MAIKIERHSCHNNLNFFNMLEQYESATKSDSIKMWYIIEIMFKTLAVAK